MEYKNINGSVISQLNKAYMESHIKGARPHIMRVGRAVYDAYYGELAPEQRIGRVDNPGTLAFYQLDMERSDEMPLDCVCFVAKNKDAATSEAEDVAAGFRLAL